MNNLYKWSMIINFLENKEITSAHRTKIIKEYHQPYLLFFTKTKLFPLCNIFEYRLMTLAMNETFLQADEKVKEDVIEELMKWGVECYDNLKEMFHFQSKQSEIFKKNYKENYWREEK